MNLRSLLSSEQHRHMCILELLYYSPEGLSNDDLLNTLDCARSVLWNDIQRINFRWNELRIVHESSLIKLQLDEQFCFSRVYSDILNTSSEFQILESLLYEEDKNITDLANKLFIGRSYTQRTLKKIDTLLRPAHIHVNYRPLRLVGDEGVIRHLFFQYFSTKYFDTSIQLPNMQEYHQATIEQIIGEVVSNNDLTCSYTIKNLLTYHFYISLWRIKNGHFFFQEDTASSFIQLPDKKLIQECNLTTRETFSVTLTEKNLKDALWLICSDSMILSTEHHNYASDNNQKYVKSFQRNQSLVTSFANLHKLQINKTMREQFTAILHNATSFYPEDGASVEILKTISISYHSGIEAYYPQLLEKTIQMVKAHEEKFHALEEDGFIDTYVYLLITTFSENLIQMDIINKPLKILIISTISGMIERYLKYQIEAMALGNFEIIILDSFDLDIHRIYHLFDMIISTETVKDIPKEFPIIYCDVRLTWRSAKQIQEMISLLSEKKSNNLKNTHQLRKSS